MTYEINDPVWILGVYPGFFAGFVDKYDVYSPVRVGIATNHGPMSAVVPQEFVTGRAIDG